MGPSFTPIKSCILNKNLQKPTPRNQENIGELGCSRPAKVACYTDKCPVQFRVWPVGDSKNKLLEVYLFYIVFVFTHIHVCTYTHWFLHKQECSYVLGFCDFFYFLFYWWKEWYYRIVLYSFIFYLIVFLWINNTIFPSYLWFAFYRILLSRKFNNKKSE